MKVKIRLASGLTVAIIFLTIVFQQLALADIFTAAKGMGGLELKTSRDISMEKETLYISKKLIRVDYLFKNQSDKDIETLVAFPLPEYPVYEDNSPYGKINFASEKNRENPVDFKLKVNGRPQAFKTEHKIRAASKDEEPFKRHYKTHFYWTQKFPAGKTVHITHTYKPTFGGGQCSVGGDEHQPRKLECFSETDMRKKFCIDPSVENATIKMPGFVSSTQIDYILRTGAHWKGPIKDFRLIVDKGKPSNIASFCADNIRKTSSTRFTADYKNFLPKKDVHVLIFETIAP